MVRPRTITMTKDGQTAEVLPPSVEVHKRHGWTVVADGAPTPEVAQPVVEVPVVEEEPKKKGSPFRLTGQDGENESSDS